MPRAFVGPASSMCVVVSLALACPARASADDFAWNARAPRYPEVTTAEWITGATTLAGAAAILFFWQPSGPHWQGPILFDEAARDALLVESNDARHTLTAASDVQFYMLLTLPTLLDAGLVIAWAHGKPAVATQMAGMNLLSYGTAGLLAYGVTTIVARERPFADECASDPDYDAGCGHAGPENSSFFSGHATAAFTGAGLTCAHHVYLPIYGGGAPDAIACAVTVAMASAVALLRVSTDNHYMSDVLVGSVVGFGLGYGLPYLLHYQHGRAPPTVAVMPLIDRDHVGLALSF